MGEKTDSIAKVDMVIAHISDCILELNIRGSDALYQMPVMAKALADLLNARTASVTADN